MEYIHTDEEVEVLNYPYGYTLRTTLYDSIIFNKRGFKYRKQTINPHTNKLNKPKITPYSFFMVRYYDEKYHIKLLTVHKIDKPEDIIQVITYLKGTYDMFNDKQQEYFKREILLAIKVNEKSSSLVNGIPMDVLNPIFKEIKEILNSDIKNNTLNFIRYNYGELFEKLDEVVNEYSK